MICQLLDYLEVHKATVLFVTATVGSAAVTSMPQPDKPWNWQAMKEWFYDFSHCVINSKNTRLSTAVIPTPPDGSAKK